MLVYMKGIEVSLSVAIDLFAGAGGLSEGFRQAGFHILAANDFDPIAAETFQQNHPESVFLPGSIGNLTTPMFLKAGGIKKRELDVLVGGPPCQAFSVYNHQRGMHDERSGLFREYLRLVSGLHPRFVVMENVTGITSIEEGRAVEEIYKRLRMLGYYVEHRILRAEEYGVPQERRRIFIIGSRDTTSITWPKPSHCSSEEYRKSKNGKLPFVTIWDAIGDLPSLKICEGSDETDYPNPPESDYQKKLREGAGRLFNHVAPYLAPVNVKRLQYIPQGGSWRDIPHALLPAGMKKAKRSDHTKRYGRLTLDGLASTILTKCDLHWGAFIHPTQERTLTVREAARLQSFPDRIRFVGSKGDQFRQVGNAVPPLLAKAVAMEIGNMLGTPADNG
jgi:DNA (cytosine-5)-methyltransferase 1